MKPIFISYTGADRAWAEWIARQLQDAGYAVLFQARDFNPTASFMAQMQQALTQAACTLAVLSPGYLSSRYCEAEWLAVLTPDPANREGRLLVVRVADCSAAGMLAPIAFADLVNKDNEADARRCLLEAVQASPAAAEAAGAARPGVRDSRRPQAAPFPPLRRRRQIFRGGRALAAGTVVTVGVAQWLGGWFPSWMNDAPFELNAAALVCGVLVALALDAGLEWRWQRRGRAVTA
jgi:hypothetical protein